jgi:hypothetical protein
MSPFGEKAAADFVDLGLCLIATLLHLVDRLVDDASGVSGGEHADLYAESLVRVLASLDALGCANRSVAWVMEESTNAPAQNSAHQPAAQ